MKKVIEDLNRIKDRLADMDYFAEAKICKDLISRLKGEDVINVSGNTGQINIASGNSKINTYQEIKNKITWND